MKQKLLLLLLILIRLSLSAEEIREMEFINKPIQDILFTLAEATNVSIITDETVNGNGSYHFSNTTLDEALSHFLPLYDLYFVKKDNIYHISRILVEYDSKTDRLSVLAKKIQLPILLEKISDAIGRTILFDPLPGERVTINSRGLPAGSILEILMHRFNRYTVEDLGDYFYIKKGAVSAEQSTGSIPVSITKKNGLFSITADSIHLSDVLNRLFALSGKEYSLLKHGDAVLDNIRFEGKPFNELLRLILERVSADFTERGGIYYIFEVSRNEILKKLDTSEYIVLQNIPVLLIPTLLPSGLSASSSLKIDKENNAVILSGSYQETAPVKNFIKQLENEYAMKEEERIDLSFITAKELISNLPPRFAEIRITRTGNPFSLIISASRERAADFLSFVRLLDREKPAEAISLKYIRSSDLLKNLPPSASSNDLVKSQDPNLVFYTGSEENLEAFKGDLGFIDKPIPQIRYELLVVQYQRSGSRDFSLSFTSDTRKDGMQTAVIGALGNLLNLNLDIVSTFGYQFALDLNAKIGDSKARVMADTTLNGLTGEDISFQNTNTYRYRDLEIDPDTGKALSTGVTREITSGLLIRINGWVSGDGTITMNVQSTVSKRGADVSSNSGNPPPTSEKIVNTHVRTQSGKPVIIGGLFQQERDLSYQRTPLLSEIPIIGRLFSGKAETTRDTEMVIYIIPGIEKPDNGITIPEVFFDDCYQNFFSGDTPWK